MLITAVNNPEVKAWRKLKQTKYRKETGLFLVSGMHLVLEAYKTGLVKTIILEQDEIFPLAADIVYVTAEIIKTLTDVISPPKIMAVCIKPQPTLELGNKLLVIAGVQDPSNLGLMLRSAVAFNIDTVILDYGTVDPYNPKCLRASQGLSFHLNIVEKELLTFLPELSNQDYCILGTQVTHGANVKTLESLPKYALVMGNEGSGLSSEIKELCDKLVYIKMQENCESLNVSVACSIILYQLSE